MATKIIKAWINGSIQEIEVEEMTSPEQGLSYEDRLIELEDKPVIADGNFLVGNGTTDLEEMTPKEVLSHIDGASVTTLTTAEYEAMSDDEFNANTLYMLTDGEEVTIEQLNGKIETSISSHNDATDAHSNMGWLTSVDEVADSPTPFDADTLNGRDASYFTTKDELATERHRIDKLSNYVTPQMFGAVADGVADDTDAVQAALDNGGYIYFPAGRYKTTRLLTVSKSCRIEMFKQYPNTYKKEYPLTPDDNWMGSRIDTYSPDGGMVIGDAVEVDGLYIRAMEGFQGVVLKFDNTIGTYTYPASVRLKHIKVEIDSPNTIPVSMFDFMPDGAYHYILEDICLGRNGDAGYCEYGFRTDLSQTNRKWAYNVTIRNLCIDLHADYPLYVAGDTAQVVGWLFEMLTIQSYEYNRNEEDSAKNTTNRPGHINLITLKNARLTTFISSYLWDVKPETIVGEIISAENVADTAVIGCGSHFDVIESYLAPKMKQPENLNITNLEMSVRDSADGTANTLILFDGMDNRKEVDIPKMTMTDEQIGNAVGTWMDANAEPREESGRNKFNPYANGCIRAMFMGTPPKLITYETNPDIVHWVTDYIHARTGDTIRVSRNGANITPYIIGCFDEENNVLGIMSGFTWDNTTNGIVITVEGTVSVRLQFYNNGTNWVYENRVADKICVTVNNADRTYEDYYTELVGGIGSFMALTSPNGTKYTLSVTDEGVLVAAPVT